MAGRTARLFGGSVFKRMYLVYTLIILLALSLLGVYLSGTITTLIADQTLNYNLQQLSSLDTVFSQQMDILRYVQDRIYALRTGPDTLLYDAVMVILQDDTPFTCLAEYDTFIRQADLVHTFFNLVQGSLPVDMALFQINGAERNRGNMNILWPSSSGGMMEYADEINAIIAARPPRSGADIDMFAFISGPGQVYERSFYVLYNRLADQNDAQRTIGHLINGYETRTLSAHLEGFSYPLEGAAYILTERGEVLFDSSGAINGEVPAFFSLLADRPSGRFSQGGYVYNTIHNTQNGVYVVGRIDEGMLQRKAAAANRSILLVAGLCALLAIGLTVLLTRTLQKRVGGVTAVMEATETGDLSVRAAVSGNGDEFDQIASSLNRMIAKIDEHIQAEYVSELARQNAILSQREAELFALQAQVNPHFLYNTLEIIRMQAVRNGDADTALLIRWLATLFRRRIHSGAVVTIREELSFCLSLVDILQAKFDGEIEVDVDFDEDILDFGILKDLIQPPLENAFLHGFDGPEDAERILTLRGEQTGEDIRITIQNTGTPMDPQALSAIQSHLGTEPPPDMHRDKHIGLINVDRRMRLAYGPDYGITIQSNATQGTAVTLTLRALPPQALENRIGRQATSPRQAIEDCEP